MPDAPDIASLLQQVSQKTRDSFSTREMLMSFGEFVADVLRAPARHMRTVPQYVRDMIDHRGRRRTRTLGGAPCDRYAVFDEPLSRGGTRIAGQERIQNEVVKLIRSFAERGRADKLICLHGPNGSGKSSLVEALFRGLEAYSETPEGALYRFNWLFTEHFERDQLGFGHRDRRPGEEEEEHRDTFAYLPPEAIHCRIACELRDSPIFLIPRPARIELLADALKRQGIAAKIPEPIADGELCQKCRVIFDNLLALYHGEWQDVVRHVQVERFFISRRYRQAAVTIEPQRNVDAQSHPVSYDHGPPLPPVLQNANLFEAFGDLIDGNRGLIEYSDFLKRPLEMNKYLLTTSERGTINLPNYMAYLDALLVATMNEKNLAMFKQEPEFSSFKGRFALVRVPYVLEISKEAEIYGGHMEALAMGKHVAPHTAEVAATWAVLTRLRRPRKQSYKDASLGTLVERLTPIEKAYLYDRGEAPDRFKDSERREIVSGVEAIRAEFDEDEEEFEGMVEAAYEGRRGASPREIMSLLADAAAAPDCACLSPLAVFHVLREFIKNTTVYEFLRLKPRGGYRDPTRFVDDVEEAYTDWIGEEIERAAALVEEHEYERLFQDYFLHVRAFGTGEKVRNRSTGVLEDPDEDLLHRVEEAIDIKEDPEAYRRNLIQRFAAYAIEHPERPVDAKELFGDIFRALRASFHRQQSKKLEQIQQHALVVGTAEAGSLAPSELQRARTVLDRLKARGYCDRCAKEVVAYHLRHAHEPPRSKELPLDT